MFFSSFSSVFLLAAVPPFITIQSVESPPNTSTCLSCATGTNADSQHGVHRVCTPLQRSRRQNSNVFHNTSHSFPYTLLSRPDTRSAKGLPISEASHPNATVTTVYLATTSQLLQPLDIPRVLAGGKHLFAQPLVMKTNITVSFSYVV